MFAMIGRRSQIQTVARRSTAAAVVALGLTLIAIPWSHAASRTADPADHWAYEAPKRAALPNVNERDWPRNPIDYYVLSRLEAQGLKPSPRADKAKLIRRVYLDLIGLPPTPDEVDAFVNDPSKDAYEKVVDRLLASPRYGEKWAQHWLDLARYADSNGYQADQLRDSWAYRDWVINALNADMPFDRFTVEQLAGDLLPNATIDQKIATGFHRTVTCNVEAGVDPEGNRVNQIFDRVNTTATVWLGTTLECAQCHDHKYDPFTMRDYYGLFAYFNNTPIEVKSTDNRMVSYDFYGPKMPLPLSPQRKAQRDAVQKQIDQLTARASKLRGELLKDMPKWVAAARAGNDARPEWHVMPVKAFTSKGGASHEVLKDQSVLLGGKNPDKDVYRVTVETDVANITGFRLETLTHPTLPANGPGRHTAPRPNFVVYEMTVEQVGPDKQTTPIKLHAAQADFSQDRWHVKGLIDGKAETGWAINPQFGKPHEATVLTHKPLNGAGQKVTFVFTFDQHYGGGRNIGRLRLSAMTGQRGKDDLPANIAKLLRDRNGKLNANQQKQLETHYLGLNGELNQLNADIAKLTKQRDAFKADSTLVMIEMDKPRTTKVMMRGDWKNPGDAVNAAPPAVLHDAPQDLPGNRLGLARWLVSPDNPLVGRVTVNRWWSRFFGDGLLRSEEDFGTQSEPPSHPKLLDWLAVEFVERGWSPKHIHKLIVMSATYQQSSRVDADLLERDPENRLLARGPRIRLSAETVRDNALAISGLLEHRVGGPPIYPPQPERIWRHVGRNAPKYVIENDADRFRRGVYVVWRRSAPYPSFVNFDAPDRAACTVQRPRTNTPLQALTLMNDPAYVEMAMALAGRMMADRPDAGVEDRVRYGFRLATGREPNAFEVAHLKVRYAFELKRYRAKPQAAAELVGGVTGWKPDSKMDKVELAAWFFVANVLLNLDETITKG